MNKILLVLRHEVYTLTSRLSFWLMLFGFPLAGFLFYGGIELLRQRQAGPDPLEIVQQQLAQDDDMLYQGYVDEAGLLKQLPPDFPRSLWQQYDDLAAGLKDLDAVYPSRLYVIPADYLSSGKIVVYSEQANYFTAQSDFSALREAIDYNLIGSPDLAAAVGNPLIELEVESLAPPDEPERDRSSMLTLFLPYAIMTLLFISIFGSSSLMLNSVAGEKENRVMEVLISSISARDMLLGKIIGLGLVGFLQIAVWASSGYLLLRLSGQSYAIPPELLLEPSILIWSGVFFVLGYLLYASLMAGVGALVPNLREASQATLIITLPMMVPFFLISVLIENPGGTLAIFLSMFPFTASLVMVLRLAASHPPLWQPLLSAALMALTVLLVIRAVARLFRAQTILSGQHFSIKKILRAVFHRG